jgi:IS30 family transposase
MDERYAITHMHAAGFRPAQIAAHLGRHRGTIGRELDRNRDALGGYHYSSAQIIAQGRRSQASRRYKLDVSPLGARVRLHLLHRWSPQQIAGRLRREHGDDSSMRVSAETIYRWVYRRHQLGERWQEWLRRRHTRRRRRIPGERRLRGQISGRVGIEQRPAVVEQRSRFGDWDERKRGHHSFLILPGLARPTVKNVLIPFSSPLFLLERYLPDARKQSAATA